ncbi:MAG: ABC transporter substrate-binding protein [Dehalococcoidia bacterium]
MRPSVWLWLPAIAGAFTLLAAACGGDDGGSSSSGSPTTTVRATAPTGDVGPGVSGTEIRLGMTSDVAGRGDTPYAAVSLAAQAYFAYLNEEQGGVCGRNITLLVEDDEYSPALALEKTQKLVTGDQVLGMIGALSTQSHQQVAPWLNDPNADGDKADGVPDLFVSTGWSTWSDQATYPWTTGFIPDYASDGRALATYITAELPDKKVGLLYREDEFGQDYLSALQASFPDEGKLTSQSYAADDTDVSQEIGAIATGGAEVVVLAATPEVAASAIKAAHGGGLSPQFLLSYVNQPSNLASELGGGNAAANIISGFEQLDGVIVSSYLMSAVEDENDEAIIEHLRIMESYAGPMVSSLSIYGQALAETVAETLSRACPDLTRANLLKAAEALSGFHPSVLLPRIDVELGASDHEAIQTMQLARINGDGTLDKLGDPIDVGP